MYTFESRPKPKLKNKRAKRVIKYFQRIKAIRKQLASTIISEAHDPRPYACVTISDEEIKGLLDTGASVSILGAGSEKFLKLVGA